ncbi:MAG: hypothetical protein WC322_04685 [Candidatus Paceibacterota bacterium]|jgi:hypothetical protein
MVDYMPALADIKARAVSAVPTVPIVQTHAEGFKVVDGIPQSYVVMTFGGPVKYGRDKGIVGGNKNPNTMWVSIQAVAALPTIAERIKQDLINSLEDYVPSNSSRMSPDGGFATDTSDDSSKPTRFVSYVRFSFVHNMATG